MKKLNLTSLILLLINLLQAQAPRLDGTDLVNNPAALEARLQQQLLRASGIQERGSAVTYVPIFFHLTGNNAGEDRVNKTKVLDELCQLNSFFAPYDLQFFIQPHPADGAWFGTSISNDDVFEVQSNTLLMEQKRHPYSINVFVVDESQTPNSGPGVLLGYYDYTHNWIVMNKLSTGNFDDVWVLGRMIGRYFGLLTTAFGWEFAPFNPDSPGWPVAPAQDPLGRPTEWMNGTNCAVGGDLLCDTPPDYGLAFYDGFVCNYTGGAKDPGGTLVDPEESNLMSDFATCAEHTISGQQLGIIFNELASPEQSALTNNFSPLFSEVPLPANWPFSPPNNTTANSATSVQVSWARLPQTGRYLLELDLVSSFATPLLQVHEVEDTTFTFNDLQPNKLYRWRVRPLTQHVFCTGTSAVHQFKTAATSGVQQTLTTTPKWRVSPNPVASGGAVQVIFDQPRAGVFAFYSTDGRLVHQFSSTPSNVEKASLQFPELSPGLYLLQYTDTGGQRLVERLVVLR